MTLIKISEYGLMGKVKNPYCCECLSNYTCYDVPEASICNGCKKHSDFESNNPSYPLTEPGEPNCEVEAELVWQKSQKHTKIWHNVEQQDYITYNNFRNFAGWVDEKGYETRQAWQISKPKVEIPYTDGTIGKVINDIWPKEPTDSSTTEVTAQSIEEDISHLAGLPLSEIYLHGVIDGKDLLIKQLTSKGMVELDKVVEILQWHMTACSMETLMDLDKVITKIKSLKLNT